MADPTTQSLLKSIIPSAVELKDMTDWPDVLVEDYLNLFSSLVTLSDKVDVEIDQKIEEIATDFSDGSIPFADNGFLIENNSDFNWNNTDNKLNIIGNLSLTLSNPNLNGLQIIGAVDQEDFLIQLRDSLLTDVYHVWVTGHISNIAGMNSEAAQFGTGMILHNYGESAPEHADIVGSYDHTGGAEESLFTRTAGAVFTESDADDNKWLVSLDLDGNTGATCEIKVWIDADNVIVEGMNWTDDLASQTWGLFMHPVYISGDGNESEFSAGAAGKFEIHSYSFINPYVAEIELDAAADNVSGLIIKAEANGYNTVLAQQINYISGALQPADVAANLLIQIDDAEAVDADITTQLAGIVCTTTNASDATKDAIVVLPGFTRALDVFGADSEDPGYGYETTSGTSVDRVNSGGGGDDAFINPAVDVELFDSNGDDALFGSDSKFEILQVILAIGSSKNLAFDFWYSKAGGNWTALVIQKDNTNGFLNSGSIVFSAPVDWTKDDEDIDGNAITDAYYIALTRTYAPALATLPTESFFKIFASQATGMYIDGQGFLKLRSSADADAPNDSVYNSTDAGVTVHKDSGGVIHDLY